MKEQKITYWVNVSQGEWGIVDKSTAEKAGRRKGFRHTPTGSGIRNWVDNLMAILKRDGTICLVEDKDEFRYLYRCLESLSIPLSFCPVSPQAEKVSQSSLVARVGRVAA